MASGAAHQSSNEPLTVSRKWVALSLGLTLTTGLGGAWLGIAAAHLALLVGLVWLPVLARATRARARQVGTTRAGFELFLLIQLLHLGEHLIQMTQLFVLGWPPKVARGLISQLDVEKVHFAWNLVVLAALIWLFVRGVRSGWLIATLAWATLHTAEHGYLLVSALRSGLESQPGILGAKGLLATWGLELGGLTAWSRPTVHFAWNLGEVALLTLAFIALIFPHWLPRPRLRMMRQAARHPGVTMALLVVALIPSAAHAPSHILYVNGTDLTCQGQAPCYQTIQAAINAATSSDYTAYRNPVDVVFDHLSGEHSRQGWFRLTAGVRFADPEPVLGLDWRGKVVPFVSRAQPLFTYVNPAGKLEYEFKKFGFAHNPIVPHTVVREARSCASCHASERALGLGQFTTREDGRPQQVTTVEGARPFTKEEIARIRNARFKFPNGYTPR